LDIGEDVLIGPHVKLLSAGHAIDEGDMVIARNRITRSRIVVGDGAWIGAGAIVLEGVTIGQGAVVAAGALVRSDVPAGMVAAGLPATIRRARRLAPDLNGVGGAEAPPAASLCAPCFLVRIMQRAVRLFGKERPAKPEA
jgi:galactoside O-acetyltransferase